jgi:hypothetical protein
VKTHALALLTAAASLTGPSGPADTQRSERYWYVGTTGSDDNPGTQDAPFRTITKGLTVLRPGDTLWVREGTYPESFIGNIPGGTSWSERVKISAFPGEAVTIQPRPGAEFVFRFDSSNDRYIVIDGFTIDADNVVHDAVKITYRSSAAHHVRIEDSEVRNAPGNGALISRSRKLVPRHNKLVNLDIHDHGLSDFGHGIYVASSGIVVKQSRIYRNAGWGVHVYNGDYPRLTANNNIVRNNRIFDNARVGDRGAGIILSSGSGNIAYPGGPGRRRCPSALNARGTTSVRMSSSGVPSGGFGMASPGPVVDASRVHRGVSRRLDFSLGLGHR